MCEETIIEISIEQSRQCGLTKQCKKLEIDWQLVDKHLEGLGDLFSKGRKITFSMEFVYKEVTCESTTAKGRKRRKVLQRLKSFKGPSTLVSGPEFTSIIVAEAKTASKDPTAGWTDEETIINYRCCDTARRTPSEDHGDVEGDRKVKLEKDCNWGLAQVEGDRWRSALQIANQFAILWRD
jgi:hypothetical protein